MDDPHLLVVAQLSSTMQHSCASKPQSLAPRDHSSCSLYICQDGFATDLFYALVPWVVCEGCLGLASIQVASSLSFGKNGVKMRKNEL